MPTEDGDPVRTRLPRAKSRATGHAGLVEQLVGARLVTVDGESVQIAHEALVRVWPRLRGWLDDDVDGQRLFRHLAGAADAWDAMGRPDSELYRGIRLSRALEWRDRAAPDLDEAEGAFLDASPALAEAERRAAETRSAAGAPGRRRLAGAVGGVGVLLVLALVAGTVAVRQADRPSRSGATAGGGRGGRGAARRGAGHHPGGPATGLLLAVEALHVDDSPQAWDNLARVLGGQARCAAPAPSTGRRCPCR